MGLKINCWKILDDKTSYTACSPNLRVGNNY